jgi:hypothetical protein
MNHPPEAFDAPQTGHYRATVVEDDEWRMVATKRCKRVADTVNIGDPKRFDVRLTLPKLKTKSAVTSQPSPRSLATKLTTFYNPYKLDSHASVRKNRPHTWQQPNHPDESTNMDTSQSPSQRPPAAEARPHS